MKGVDRGRFYKKCRILFPAFEMVFKFHLKCVQHRDSMYVLYNMILIKLMYKFYSSEKSGLWCAHAINTMLYSAKSPLMKIDRCYMQMKCSVICFILPIWLIILDIKVLSIVVPSSTNFNNIFFILIRFFFLVTGNYTLLRLILDLYDFSTPIWVLSFKVNI